MTDFHSPFGGSALVTKGEWATDRPRLHPPEQPPSCSVPANQRLWNHNSQRTAPIEQSRQHSESDPLSSIDPSKPHAALDGERKLPTQSGRRALSTSAFASTERPTTLHDFAMPITLSDYFTSRATGS